MRATTLLLFSLLSAGSAAAQAGDARLAAQLVIEVSSAGEEAGERVGSVQSGWLRQGQTRRFAARLEAGRCYLFVGRGAPSIDNLDVSLARGRTVLTRDSATGRAADVRHCAGERAERVRWSVTAFRGQGAFAAAVYRLPEGSDAASAVEEVSGVTALERLDALAAARAGDMRPVTPPRRETLSEGERVEREVSLEPGRCYRVLVAGEGGIGDVDVALLGPDGGALQSDEVDGRDAYLGVLRPLCPGQPGQYRVALRVEQGGGSFAWQVRGSAPGGAAREVRTARPSRYRVGGTGSGFVAERIRARHRAVGEGRQPVTDLVTGRLRTSEEHRIPLEVEGGRCYVVIAAGMPSVRELNLRVLDPYGNERARDETRDAFPSVRFCPSVAGRWTVEIDMFNGYGQWGAQAFAGP